MKIPCRKIKSLKERFFDGFKKSQKCWLWKRCRSGLGYGMIFDNWPRRRMLLSHRVSWEIANGPIPKGHVVLHRCDNRLCVKPTHLRIGTQSENIAEMFRKGRNTQPIGERHPNAKLSEEKVKSIRKMYAAGKISQRALAYKFDVTQGIVQKIIARKNWRHVSG